MIVNDGETKTTEAPEAGALDLLETIQPLEPEKLEAEETVGEGLILRHPRLGEVTGVTVHPCFPISRPNRFLVFRDEEGEELGMLEDAHLLEPESRQALCRELDKQHFVPIITHVNDIYREFQIPIWEVETDRGPRRLELKSTHDAYRAGGRKIYIRDAEGNPYLIPDVRDLDEESQALVQLHV